MLAAQLALAFGLELVALTAFGLWGVSLGPTPVSRVVLGVGAPLLMTVFWGTFLSPKAAVPLSPAYRLVLKLCVFALVTAALFAWRPLVGAVFGGVAAVTTVATGMPTLPHTRRGGGAFRLP